MKRLLQTGLLALCGTALGAGPSRAQEPPPPDLARLRETLQQLTLDLREARGLAAGVADRNLRTRLEQLITRMEQRKELLEKQLAGAEAVHRPAGEADFAKFQKALKAEPFDDKKLALLRDYAKHQYFTSAQAATLVQQFRLGSAPADAAIALHPRLVDPANFYEVLAVIRFESDKEKVRKALGIKYSGPERKAASGQVQPARAVAPHLARDASQSTTAPAPPRINVRPAGPERR